MEGLSAPAWGFNGRGSRLCRCMAAPWLWRVVARRMTLRDLDGMPGPAGVFRVRRGR